jgi:hypothetical protein
MNDMMNIMVVLFFAGVVGLPILMSIFASVSGAVSYEPPKSLGESLKEYARRLPVMLLLFVVINWSRTGFIFDKWYWGMLVVLPVMVLLALFVDWLIIRRRKKRTTI